MVNGFNGRELRIKVMKKLFGLGFLSFVMFSKALGYSTCPPQWPSPPPPCETCPCPPGTGPAGSPGSSGGPGFGGGLGGGLGGGCSTCRINGVAASASSPGMTTWQVREAQVDYRLFDTPL